MANLHGHIGGCGCNSCSSNIDTTKLWSPTACIDIRDYIFTCEKLRDCVLFNVNTETQTFDVQGQGDVNFISPDSTVNINLDSTTNTIELTVDEYVFKCTELSGCSISNLQDVNVTNPADNEILVFSGGTWINTTAPADQNYFVSGVTYNAGTYTVNVSDGNSYPLDICRAISGCTVFTLTDGTNDIDVSGGTSVIFTSSGNTIDISIDESTGTINLEGFKFDCDVLSGCSIDNIGDVTITNPTNDQIIIFSGGTWVNADAPAIPPSSDIYTTGVTIDNNFLATFVHNSGSTYDLDLSNLKFKCDDLSGCTLFTINGEDVITGQDIFLTSTGNTIDITNSGTTFNLETQSNENVIDITLNGTNPYDETDSALICTQYEIGTYLALGGTSLCPDFLYKIVSDGAGGCRTILIKDVSASNGINN